MKTTTLLSMALVSFTAAVSAENAPDLQTSAYRNSIAQEEVRKQADQVRAQLQVLLEDFQQNGIQSPELVQIQQTIEKLSKMSDEDILPLVQMLKDAGGAPQSGDAAGKLAVASQTQKNIQLNLKKIGDRLALQMNQASMTGRLQQLILAQTGNLRQTKELAESGKPGPKVPRELAPIYTLSQSEQARIQQETALMLETLEKVVNGIQENGRGGFATALAEAKRIQLAAIATTASGDLSNGNFPEALGSEGKLLDGLQTLLIKIKEGQSVQDRLASMAAKLQELASRQGQLAQTTARTEDPSPQTFREMQKQLSNEVEALQKELMGLSAGAATQTEEAEKSMQVAVDVFHGNNGVRKGEKNNAVVAQKDAASKLQAAADALQSQAKQLAAAAGKAPETAAQAMQELAQLDAQVKDAMSRQNALNAAPAAASPGAQQKLAEDTAKLQQQAMTASPQAAQNIGQAATEMNQPSPAQAQQAAQSLALASAQIEQQMAAVQQAMDQQAALQAMAAPIQAAQAQVQQAANSMQQKPQDLTGAVNQTMAAQQTLNQAQQTAATAPADVAQALKDAQAQLESSVLQAAQTKAAAAAAANAQAQASLNQAMQSLNQAMAAAAADAAAAAPAMAGTPSPAGGPGTPGQPGAPTPGTPGTPGAPTAGQNQMVQGGTGGMGTQGVQGLMGSSGKDGGPAEVASGLKPKDRAAVSLLQKEKAPAEYQGMVQQYLKNLADGASPGHGAQ